MLRVELKTDDAAGEKRLRGVLFEPSGNDGGRASSLVFFSVRL